MVFGWHTLNRIPSLLPSIKDFATRLGNAAQPRRSDSEKVMIDFQRLKLKRLTLVVLFVCVAAICGACHHEQPQAPLERGIASPLQEWLNQTETTMQPSLFPLETQSELQSNLDQEVKTLSMPGAVLALSSAQQTWMTATGEADMANHTAMQPSDRFRVGNISELFIAVVCLQLEESDVLDLEDPITNWLPTKITKRIPQSQWIKIRQLLNHTSGIPDFEAAAFQQAVKADPSHRWTVPELLEFMLDRKPAAPRGTFSYSTANYLLLQLIVERATGESLAKALQAHIINPLHLKNTFVELSSKQPLAQGYQDWNQDGVAEDVMKPLINTGLGLGGNAIVSNAPDLIQFFQALFLDGSLIGTSSLQKILALVDTNSGGYGLGISHSMTRWGEVWGQVSSTTGFSAAVFYLPVHDLILVTWTNSVGEKLNRPIDMAEKSLNIVLANPYRIAN
jgi:D-alanyl-D-alanine carboxypeptidase